jgi:hypothetical protein
MTTGTPIAASIIQGGLGALAHAASAVTAADTKSAKKSSTKTPPGSPPKRPLRSNTPPVSPSKRSMRSQDKKKRKRSSSNPKPKVSPKKPRKKPSKKPSGKPVAKRDKKAKVAEGSKAAEGAKKKVDTETELNEQSMGKVDDDPVEPTTDSVLPTPPTSDKTKETKVPTVLTDLKEPKDSTEQEQSKKPNDPKEPKELTTTGKKYFPSSVAAYPLRSGTLVTQETGNEDDSTSETSPVKKPNRGEVTEGADDSIDGPFDRKPAATNTAPDDVPVDDSDTLQLQIDSTPMTRPPWVVHDRPLGCTKPT